MESVRINREASEICGDHCPSLTALEDHEPFGSGQQSLFDWNSNSYLGT